MTVIPRDQKPGNPYKVQLLQESNEDGNDGR